MTSRTRLLSLQLLVVIPVCFVMFFFGLGSFGLVGADEPRYAQIAREMLARHDWIVPTLNGQPWLEKPVLLYWREMFSYSILGVHDWVARVPAAVHATVLVIVILFFMRRFRPGTELDAALITASCAAMIGFGRAASTDIILSVPFCLAMLAWWVWHETSRRLWLGAFYLLLGVGALAKGPISPALAVLIVGAYSWLRRDLKIFLRSLWLPGFGIFFVVVLPWYVAVQIKVPEFFRVFFLEHNLERFGTNLYQHSQPFWYYIPVFIIAMLPWSVFTLPALGNAVRRGWAVVRKHREENVVEAVPEDWLEQFLMLWILIPVIFFSISRSKLPGYILPAIPAATMLTALYLHRAQNAGRIKLILHSLVCGTLIGASLVVPWFMLKIQVPHSIWTAVAIVTGITASSVLLTVHVRGLRMLHFVTLIPVVLGLVFLLRFAAIPERSAYPFHGSIIDLTQSARSVDAELTKLGAGSKPVAVFNVRREVEYGLNYYRNQPVPRYERDGIPAGDHVVVAKSGSAAAIQALAEPRKVTPLGDFAPQHLEFFEVSNSK